MYLSVTEKLVVEGEPQVPKLVVEGEPQVPRSVATLPNDLLVILGNHVGDPGKDDDVHSSPHRIVGEGVVALYMDSEEISRQGHQLEITPEGVVRGRGVEDDAHQLVNVRNHRSLEVEVGDDGHVVRGVHGGVGRSRGSRGRRQLSLGDDGCPLKVIGGGLFVLEELSGGLHTMTRGGGLSFSGVGILDEGLEALPESLSLLIGRHDDRVAATPGGGGRRPCSGGGHRQWTGGDGGGAPLGGDGQGVVAAP
jgi:hypothetical protein